MPVTEAELKRHLKEATAARLYFFCGEESYLSAHYAERVASAVVGKDEFSSFNYHKFDGQDFSIDAPSAAWPPSPQTARL